MAARTRQPLRTRSALAAAGVAAAAAAAAAFLSPVLSPAVTAAALGVVLAGAAGALVWVLLAPVAELTRAASDDRLDLATLSAAGELDGVAGVVRRLAAAHTRLATDYDADLTAVAGALMSHTDTKAGPVPPTLAASPGGPAGDVLTAFAEAGRELAATRQRLGTALRILTGLPDAVVVCDSAGAVRYFNPAAERMFGAGVQRRQLSALLAPTTPAAATGDDPDRPLADAAALADWVRTGTHGTVTVHGGGEVLVEVAGASPRGGNRDGLIYLIGRDLTAAREREAADRFAIRANATRQLLDRYLAESDEPLAQLAAQHRLLTGDAKQSGQRDALLAKLTAAGRSLRQLETFHALAHWFRATAWGELPAPTPSEFQAAEVANRVSGRLAGRLKARGNTLKVVDNGGWVYADADRVEAALTGLLAHACDASTNAPLELRVHRLPVAPGQSTAAVEFQVPDAGPALPAGLLAVIDRPFGGLAPAPLDRFDGHDGWPLGLVVAARLAAALDGELAVDSDAGGQLGLRLRLPTRLGGGQPPVTVAAPGNLDIAPLDEIVNGWRLGAPSA